MAYQVVFSSPSVASLTLMPKRWQRRLLIQTCALAENPFWLPDFTSRDDDGREIAHLRAAGWVVTYWVDHAAKLVMIIEFECVE